MMMMSHDSVVASAGLPVLSDSTLSPISYVLSDLKKVWLTFAYLALRAIFKSCFHREPQSASEMSERIGHGSVNRACEETLAETGLTQSARTLVQLTGHH